MPFNSDTNATELNIDTSKKFIVINNQENFDKGTIIALKEDDESYCPLFENKEGETEYISWDSLEYAPEFNKGDIVITELGTECEFIHDLIEPDCDGCRYIIKYNGAYILTDSITKKEDDKIQQAIDLLTKAGKIKDGKILV